MSKLGSPSLDCGKPVHRLASPLRLRSPDGAQRDPGYGTVPVSASVNLPSQKYSALPKFGSGVCVVHPDPAKGAVVRRFEPRIGERWTRQRRAREAGAGRDQPREVLAACGRAALKRTAKSRGPGCRCYSHALRRCVDPNRAKRAVNSRGRGRPKERSAPGRARHTPSNHRAGKAGRFRLNLSSVVHCVCILIARRTSGCQPAPGLPCALSL